MGWGPTFTLFTHYPRYGDALTCDAPSWQGTNFHTVPSSRRSPKSNPTHQLPLATTTASIIIPRLLHDSRFFPSTTCDAFLHSTLSWGHRMYILLRQCLFRLGVYVVDRKVNYCFWHLFLIKSQWLNNVDPLSPGNVGVGRDVGQQIKGKTIWVNEISFFAN